jgi:hypothetical protein
MDEDARIIEMIIGVAGNMGSPVDHQHALARIAREAFGHHRAGKARADDEIIVMRLGARVAARLAIASSTALRMSLDDRIPRLPASAASTALRHARPGVCPRTSARSQAATKSLPHQRFRLHRACHNGGLHR